MIITLVLKSNSFTYNNNNFSILKFNLENFKSKNVWNYVIYIVRNQNLKNS